MLINNGVGTADQWERGTATQQPITRICSPAVVELVRTNLAPDFPLFHVSLYLYLLPNVGFSIVHLQQILRCVASPGAGHEGWGGGRLVVRLQDGEDPLAPAVPASAALRAHRAGEE